MFGRLQTPPLSASVIVTTPAAPVALATEQFWKPFVSSTVGLAGTVKTDVACGKATVIVSFAWRAPVAVALKPTVHVARALAASVVAAKVTVFATCVCAEITGAARTARASESTLVLTVQRAAAGAPATPLVTPRICTAAVPLFGRLQTPPLSASVIVTVVPAPTAEATEQLKKPVVSSTVGLAGTVKTEVAFGKTTVIVSPAWIAPVGLTWKPIVQVARAFAASVDAAKVTLFTTRVWAAITGAARTGRASESALVLTVQLAATGEPAAPLVTPRICTEAAALFGRVQTPPLSASVIVTVVTAPVAVAEQFWKPAVSSTVGLAGTVKTEVAFGKATVIVSLARRAPVAVAVNPIVQVARASAVSVVAAKVTVFATWVWAAITGAARTGRASESALVATVQLAAAGEPATPLVTPRICTAAAALLGSVQTPPLSASVIVTVVTAPVAVAEQFWKPFVSSTVGVAGTLKTEVAFGKATVIVSLAWSAPVAVAVKPTVHVARALAASVVAAKVTVFATCVWAVITGATPTGAAVESELVLTVQLAAAGEPATPLVTPRIWTAAAALLGTVQAPPLLARVIVTTPAAPVALATEQFWKPLVSSTVGLAGTLNTEVTCGKATVIVSPVSSAPVAVEVKPTVQVVRADAASVVAANVTAAGVVAAPITMAAPGLTGPVLSAEVCTLNVLAR